MLPNIYRFSVLRACGSSHILSPSLDAGATIARRNARTVPTMRYFSSRTLATSHVASSSQFWYSPSIRGWVRNASSRTQMEEIWEEDLASSAERFQNSTSEQLKSTATNKSRPTEAISSSTKNKPPPRKQAPPTPFTKKKSVSRTSTDNKHTSNSQAKMVAEKPLAGNGKSTPDRSSIPRASGIKLVNKRTTKTDAPKHKNSGVRQPQSSIYTPPSYDDIPDIDFHSVIADDYIDPFDIDISEAEMAEASSAQVSDSISFDPNVPPSEEQIEGWEGWAEHELSQTQSVHLERAKKISKTRQIVEPAVLQRSDLQLEDPVKSRKTSNSGLDMRFSYGLGKRGEKVPSRFDWRKRATSQTGQRDRYSRWRIMPTAQMMNPSDRWFEGLANYRDKYLPLVEMEYQAEVEAATNRLVSTPKQKLVKQGFCLADLGGRWEQRTITGRQTATFSFVGSRATSRFNWNRLSSGSAVRLSRNDMDFDPAEARQVEDADDTPERNQDTSIVVAGSVTKQEPGRITVTFPTDVPDLETGLWRLDLWVSDIVLKRTTEAFQALQYDPLEMDAQSTRLANRNKYADAESGSRNKETVLMGTALRDILLRDFAPSDLVVHQRKDPASPQRKGIFSQDQLIQSWCTRQLRGNGPALEVEGDPIITLNDSQRRAVATMLSERISLIQGPPGTGKTRTIIEALHLLKAHWQVSVPILVTGYTNTSVDNLAMGLKARNLKVLRYGAKIRIREELWPETMDGYIERHRSRKALNNLKIDLARLPRDEASMQKRVELQRRLFGAERYIMDDIAAGVDIVCATCISSVSRLLEVFDFPVVFFDEASMATEPSSLIPLTKGCAHLAIIGDHKQLPPVVISPDAKKHLTKSLFERLKVPGIGKRAPPSVMLNTQYRMHPAISAFPNKRFYNFELRDGTVSAGGKVRPDLVAPRTAFLPTDENGSPRNLSFVDHDNPEEPNMGSIQNTGEANIVASIVMDLLIQNPNIEGSDIGVIAPYAAQISAIIRVLHDEQRVEQFAHLLGSGREKLPLDVEINTVDGFQGREKKIIIFSTTRCNQRNAIGFLDDWRRLNVALTRAQAAMIVVGSERTLAKASVFQTNTKGTNDWREMMRDLRLANAIIKYDGHNIEHEPEEIIQSTS